MRKKIIDVDIYTGMSISKEDIQVFRKRITGKAWYYANTERAKNNHRTWNETHIQWRAEYSKEYYAENKEQLQEQGRSHYAENKERYARNHKSWNDANKDWRRRYQREKLYGITLEQWEALYEKQHGLCAICSTGASKEDMHTDHCHDTNIIRGLLCRDCNLGLGNFKDDIGRLLQAVEYLSSTGV